MSASSVVTTASGTADFTGSTISVNNTLASGTKDVAQITLITSVTGSGHTHAVTIPTSVVNYIIKT